VQFAPTAAVLRTGSLTASASPGGSDSSSLTGTGQTPAALSLAPASHPFGNVPIGSQPTFDFTLSNGGQETSGALTLAATGTDYSISSEDCPATLAGGASCTITVQFAPTAAVLRNGSVSATASPGGSDSSSLTGTGITAAQLTITPQSQDFGLAIKGGQSSAVFDFTVTNTGQQTSGTVGMSMNGAHPGDFTIVFDGCSGVALGQNDTCLVQVQFEPTTFGNRTAKLTALATPGGGASADLSGTGFNQASLSIINAQTGSNFCDFGQVLAGLSSGPCTMIVQNTGNTPVGPLTPAISGQDATIFKIIGDNCSNTTLAAGQNCQVQLQATLPFAPAGIGNFTAHLFVAAGATASSASLLVEGVFINP
jgi:hypothetical protein